MTSGAHPPEIEAQQQLITGLLRWLVALDSDGPWSDRLLTAQPLASGEVRYELVERRDAGERREADLLPDDGVAEAVCALQQYMYSPTGGAWLSTQLSVTSAGQGDARFNYEEEPQLSAPGDTTGGMSPGEVAAHLRTFPRPRETVPEWMHRHRQRG